MGTRYLVVSLACTSVSFVGLQYWTELSLDKLRSEGVIGEDVARSESTWRLLQLLFSSYATTGLLANFLINVFILLNLCLKTVFFSELYPSEIRKLVERLINYVIYKGTFLPVVIPPTVFQMSLWSIWLTFLCSFKMFQALARDRLERLNASPSATPWTYLRAYSALLLVLAADLFWIRICLEIYRSRTSAMLLLLFFEPLSIAFETLQAVLVHGFQLLDIWVHHSAGSTGDCQRLKVFERIAHGSLSEWKGILIRNLGFALDVATLLMALGHYMQIWWLRGMVFHLADAVLFLNIRALLSALVKRVKGFIKLKVALGSLHAALPDATSEELQAYDDECAICREPMVKAKKLHCNHLFHLACLRSWLDQGLNEVYSCPTCRKPLFVSRSRNEASGQNAVVTSDEQLARQLSEGLNGQNADGQNLSAELFPSQTHEGSPWRSAGLEPSWIPTWPTSGADVAGPSTAGGPIRLGRVHMMMRHLASVGETYGQTALDDPAWSLWPTNPNQASASGSGNLPPVSGRHNASAGSLHVRTAPRSVSDDFAHILAMAETVREVLPHIPDELILQDLQRTKSVAVTVNNLLQM